MRVVVQRVGKASVLIGGEIHSEIDGGLLVYAGIEHTDDGLDVLWLADKITKLRIFSDGEGKMNKSIQEVDGSVLVISQFTLHAKTKKGNRPSFINAARPEQAIPLYNQFIEELKQRVRNVKTGIFAAEMFVSSVNNGPVTILIDSKSRE
jgi:D-tyrosyl-tRNA(Tyr) deacylase